MVNTSTPGAKIGAAVGLVLTGAVWLVLGAYAGMLESALAWFDGEVVVGKSLKYAAVGAVSGLAVGALIGSMMRSASGAVIGATVGAVLLAASGAILKGLNLLGSQVGYGDVLEAMAIGVPIGGVTGALLGAVVGWFVRQRVRGR